MSPKMSPKLEYEMLAVKYLCYATTFEGIKNQLRNFNSKCM